MAEEIEEIGVQENYTRPALASEAPGGGGISGRGFVSAAGKGILRGLKAPFNTLNICFNSRFEKYFFMFANELKGSAQFGLVIGVLEK